MWCPPPPGPSIPNLKSCQTPQPWGPDRKRRSGQVAAAHSWPWLVRLETVPSSPRCTGVIVGRDALLTSAQCCQETFLPEQLELLLWGEVAISHESARILHCKASENLTKRTSLTGDGKVSPFTLVIPMVYQRVKMANNLTLFGKMEAGSIKTSKSLSMKMATKALKMMFATSSLVVISNFGSKTGAGITK